MPLKRWTYESEKGEENQRDEDHVNADIDGVVVVGTVLDMTSS